MKRIIAKGLLALAAALFLTSCAYKNPYPKTDQTNETWPAYVQNTPNSWIKGASSWFLTGGPNTTEEENMAISTKRAMSTMSVNVCDFNKISVNGPFQVQLFGTYEANSVYIYGPNNELRQVAVEVRGDTLYVRAVDKACSTLCNVIIRIGVNNLAALSQYGSGRIEGRLLRSTGLDIYSNGTGNIYLAGDINLRKVVQDGNGTINVFGTRTPMLDISTSKRGGVNISGNVGLRTIYHKGQNDINVIGANGGCAKICTSGCGKIGLLGAVNLREIKAGDTTSVYAYCVRSDSLYAYVSGKARVGLAGSVNDLSVTTSGLGQFYGRDLLSQGAYMRADDASHINVTARDKIYAASTGNSSVYFFGSPNMLSQYLSGGGSIIPIWYDKANHFPLCAVAAAPCNGYKDKPPVCKKRCRDLNKYVK